MMKRQAYLSYIRALACIAIVILHTTDAAVILYQDQISNGERIASLSVVYCMMWAVPCFVMVTGALLLDKNRSVSLKDVFRKYILRILIALFAFALIFAFFDSLMNRDGGGLSFIPKGIVNALTGNSWAHLWYLYLLIGLYLFLVIYRAVAHHISVKEYRYMLLVFLIFLSILPILKIWNIEAGFYIHTATIYPFYLFAGYAIADGKIRISRPVAILLLIIGVAGIVVFNILAARRIEISNSNLLGYSSIFVVALSAGVFSLVKSIPTDRIAHTQVSPTIHVYEEHKPGFFGRILLEIDRCSFGIYLIHMIFVRLVLRYWQVNPFALQPSILVFIGLILAFLAVSYGLTFLFKLIPGVRRIL